MGLIMQSSTETRVGKKRRENIECSLQKPAKTAGCRAGNNASRFTDPEGTLKNLHCVVIGRVNDRTNTLSMRKSHLESDTGSRGKERKLFEYRQSSLWNAEICLQSHIKVRRVHLKSAVYIYRTEATPQGGQGAA